MKMATYDVYFDQTETVTKSYMALINDQLTQEIFGKNVEELTNSELQECVWAYSSPEENHEDVIDISDIKNVDCVKEIE